MSKLSPVMADEVAPEFFIRQTPENAPLFTMAEGARLLRRPGQDEAKPYNQLKYAGQQGLVHRRWREGTPRGAALYGLDDLASAAVLFALFDLGIRDEEISNRASVALYSWSDRNPQTGWDSAIDGLSPAAAALRGTLKGEFWFFKSTAYRCDQTGKRDIVATVQSDDVGPPRVGEFLASSYLPESTITVAVGPLLLPLTRALKKGAN